MTRELPGTLNRRNLLQGAGAAASVLAASQLGVRVPGAAAQSAAYPAAGKPHAGVKLRVAMVAEPKPEMLKSLIGEFQDLTGIEVSFDDLAYPTLQEKQLTALTQGGEAYDVVHVDSVWMGQYAGNGWIGSIEDLIAASDPKVLDISDFLPKLMDEICTWEGVRYGLPFDTSVMMFYYRPDLLQKYNLGVPKTWDDVLAAATKITQAEKANDVYGLTLMAKRGVQLSCTYANLLGSYGGSFYDENYVSTMNKPEAVTALDMLVKLVGVSNAGSLAQDYDEGDAFFSSGKAAMFLQWNDSIPAYGDANKSKIVGKWEVAVMPGTAQADGTMLHKPMIGGWNTGILADTKQRDAAWEFLLWATSKQMETRLAAAQPPARASILNDPKVVAAYPQYPQMLESFNLAWGRPRISVWPQLTDNIEAALSQAVSGEKSAQDALGGINDTLNQVLKEGGFQK